MDEYEREWEREWAYQQAMGARAMEQVRTTMHCIIQSPQQPQPSPTITLLIQAEFEEKQMRATRKEADLAYLLFQQTEQRRKRLEWEKNRFGTIGGGFFEGFGKSHR